MIKLHWLTAIALVFVFTLAIAREFVESPAWDRVLLGAHRVAGIAAFFIVLVRLVGRVVTHRPPMSSNGLARIAARSAHGALYLLLASAPVLGYLLTCARLGRVDLFGLQLASPIARNRELAETLESIHHVCGWLLLGLIAVHTAAALWHHFVARDQVLIRMLPHQWPTPPRNHDST